eukprot:TRINITY_DN2812_c0_g3_i3.p1 TRINITY_DN2812_c0_g3~~TRINITY_DN2812_c0_g3_i3.p1  ORF type:complete len:246 (+),score=26.58 TRINITY_DN2812_c0_g3_i3:150-887(+)
MNAAASTKNLIVPIIYYSNLNEHKENIQSSINTLKHAPSLAALRKNSEFDCLKMSKKDDKSQLASARPVILHDDNQSEESFSISIYEDSFEVEEKDEKSIECKGLAKLLHDIAHNLAEIASEEDSRKRRIKAQLLTTRIEKASAKYFLKNKKAENDIELMSDTIKETDDYQEKVRKRCRRLAESTRSENNMLQCIVSEIEKNVWNKSDLAIKPLKNERSKSILKFIMETKRYNKAVAHDNNKRKK